MSKKATLRQLEELEERLTKQMLCSHDDFYIKDRSYYPLYCPEPISINIKVCSNCGLKIVYETDRELNADRKLLLTREIKRKQAELKKLK